MFAPVAAHLSLGVPLEELGPRLSNLYSLAVPRPESREGGIVGQVIRVDHFGNLVSNLRPADVSALDPLELMVHDQVLRELRRYYAEGQGLGGVVGSTASSRSR